MKSSVIAFLVCAGAAIPLGSARANMLANGNLDRVHDVEIVPGFFLPKPDAWENVGTRTLSGPYEDEGSSEPWAGPAPTPVTADGLANPAPYNTNPDLGFFFKGFTGNVSPNGLATGHLLQTVPATAGLQYDLTGWAGAEANYLGGAEFALEFLNGGGGMIGAAVLDLVAAGLFTDNGLAFDYKQFGVSATAPAGTEFVRVRVSMLNAMGNPAGGGQAYVVDDFVLVPAPSAGALGAVVGIAALRRRRAR